MRSLLLLLVAVLLAACSLDTFRSTPRQQTEPVEAFEMNPDDFVTTASGLQRADVEQGTGAEATPGRVVVVHYTGRLTSGETFDSSRRRNQPFSFTLGEGEVIRGWDEGVAGMRVGGKRVLVVPPQLGYGSQPVGPIPPNSTLVFDVELLDVR